MATKTKIETPSVLSFSRVLDPTDVLFHQENSQEPNSRKPVEIQQRAIRTTKSHRFKPTVTKKLDTFKKEASESNIQLTQTTYLDFDCDTLIAEFSLKVLPFNGTPESCNSTEYKKEIMRIVDEYAQKNEFKELSERYVTNIANGRWLWRNRYVSQGAVITVEARTESETKTFEFNTKDFSLKTANASSNDSVRELALIFADALKGKHYLVLYVSAKVDIGYGHQVFPSEDMNLGEISNEDANRKSKKQLFHINGVAGMHSVKVGNALRTIDTWFEGYEDYQSPISIEVYGAVTRIAEAFRVSSSKQDFYSLLDGWLEKGDEPDLNGQHFVMATLIRGGLFGKSAK